jgi:hypothetical protein
MVRHFLSPVVTKAVAGFVVGCALVLPARAHAQTPTAPPPAAASGGGGLGQGFGDTGQIVISGDPGALSASFVKVNHGGWTAAVTPAADYFVVPSVSVGVNATFLIGADDRKGFAVGARAGYNLNVTENVGAWPLLGISYLHESGPFAGSATRGQVYLPILYHFAPRVFAGIGPFYDVKLAGDGNNSYGVKSTVGGWF